MKSYERVRRGGRKRDIKRGDATTGVQGSRRMLRTCVSERERQKDKEKKARWRVGGKKEVHSSGPQESRGEILHTKAQVYNKGVGVFPTHTASLLSLHPAP